MDRHFQAIVSRIPVDHIGAIEARVNSVKAEIQITNTEITIDRDVVRYPLMLSAEIQAVGTWPFKQYLLNIATIKFVYTIHLPKSEVDKEYPFKLDRTEFLLKGKKEWTREIVFLSALIALWMVSELRN